MNPSHNDKKYYISNLLLRLISTYFNLPSLSFTSEAETSLFTRPPNLKLHSFTTHQHSDVVLFISNKLGIFVPLLICEVLSKPSDEKSCMSQTLFSQLAFERPYRMDGVKSYLLGVSISNDWACLQEICFNGWLSEHVVLSIHQRTQYFRDNLSIDTFYSRFFLHVLRTLITGVKDLSDSELASLFAHPSPAFRFGMESARLPLAKCLNAFIPCNILHCTLSEFKKHIPSKGILFNRLLDDPQDDTSDTSVVIKASGEP